MVDATLTPGDTLVVAYTVENAGNTAVSPTVTLTVDGTAVDSRTIGTLAPDESQGGLLTWVPQNLQVAADACVQTADDQTCATVDVIQQ